jgi:hypothetical protein
VVTGVKAKKMSNDDGKSLVKILRPQQFRYGGDFKQLFSRFQQYVELGKIKDDDLNLIFSFFLKKFCFFETKSFFSRVGICFIILIGLVDRDHEVITELNGYQTFTIITCLFTICLCS